MSEAQPTPVVPVVDPNAWQHEPGPTLLLAGPGTGKTHQLALRIRHLVQTKSVAPDAITVITFTREAAENMRRRISDEEKKDVYLPPEQRPSRILTMHSLGLEIVRLHADLLDLPTDFEVMTNSALRRILFRDAAFLAGFDEAVAQDADHARQSGTSVEPKSPIAAVITQYEQLLRANSAIDYDDEINLACGLLESDPELLKTYATGAQHLLVDEYQDINPGQRKMIDLLSRANPAGVFVVGDDDQSIYSFRGGSPRYIRQFRDEFGAAASVLSLAVSRRCPEPVLLGALDVIATHDSSRIPKPAPTFPAPSATPSPITVHDVATDEQEAGEIARLAAAALPKKTFLVLIPARQYAPVLKRELRRRKISYDLPPNLDDSGLVLVGMIYDWTQNPSSNFPLRMCLEALCDGGTLDIPSKKVRKDDKKAARAAALTQVAALWSGVLDGRESLWEALQTKAGDKGIFDALLAELQVILESAADDLPEFLAQITKNAKPWARPKDFVREVHTWLEELRGTPGSSQQGEVRIMTLQAAKGLEADVVCVVGLDEGVIPRQRATAEEVTESARLTGVS